MRKTHLFLLGAALVLAGRPSLQAAAKPLAVVKSFDAAWNAQDAEKVLALFTDDVVIRLALYPGREQMFRGKAQARGFVQAHIAGFRVVSRDHVADGMQVNWKSEAGSDAFRSMGIDVVRFEEEARVENGLIKTLSAVAAPESGARILQATEQANKKAAAEFVDAVFNRHDIGAIDKYVSRDFVDHMPFPGSSPDAAGFKTGVAGYFSAFPDIRVSVEDSLAEGDRVALRVKSQGTQRGAFAGKPASNRPFSVEEIHIVRIVDGKLLEHWGAMDTAEMMRQLTPQPAKKKQ